MRRERKCLWTVPWLFLGVFPCCLAAGEVSREALQSLYVEPAAVAVTVDKPPTIDGQVDEPAWRAAEAMPFGFCDATTPGRPKNTTDVRLAGDRKHLYVAFVCKELRSIRAKAAGQYNEDVPKDDHVSILLKPSGHRWCGVKHPNACILIKVTAKSATWARRYRHLDGDARPGEAIKIDGLTAASRVYPGRWEAEVRIPFSSLFEDAAKMPAVWRVNFFRKRWARLYSSVHPGDPGYANWTTSWKAAAALATFCPSPDLFGILYVPAGKVVPDKIRDLKAGKIKIPRKPTKPTSKPPPPPGFKLSRDALAEYLHSPVAFVPHVSEGPRIDGELSDAVWRKAHPLVLRYLDLYVPGEVEKNRTRIRLLADDKHLYAGYDCGEDFMQEIRARCDGVDPSGLWRDDCIDILLDPGRTETFRYFYLGINAKGAYTKRRMKNDQSWQPRSLRIKTSRAADRWQVEVRVAFADLGIRPGEFPKVWGGNFFRIRYPRRPTMDETPGWQNWDYAWRPNLIGTGHIPDLFGYLVFQKADVVIDDVADYMESKGLDLAAMGLRRQKPKAPPPAASPRQRPASAFARKPQVSRRGKNAVVRFAAKAPTDVAVWIADARGKVVRHLAGGVLGKNAPPPLKADSLEQQLLWDGRDDDGKKLPAGKYRVRVALGLGAKFERIIGWRPGIGTIRSLAVSPEGELYVCTGGASVDHGWANSSIRVFDRRGRCLRQVYPYPPNLPAGKMAGIQPIRLANDRWLPVIYNALNHSWLPESPAIGTQQAAVTRDDRIILTNMCMRGMSHGRRLLKLGTDGSAPADMLGPEITRYAMGGEMYVALSPDEKTIYVTGLRGRSLWDPGEYHDVVYRVKWGAAALRDRFREPFIGQFQTPGADARHLSNPRGLAVDKDGTIVVADYGNGRLACFRPDGSPLKQIPLPGANKVAVDRRTGCVYVLTSGAADRARACKLIKLKSVRQPSEVARLEVSGWRRGALAMAVDSSGKPPLIWLGSGDKIADLGGRLARQGNLHEMQAGGPYAKQAAGFEGNLMTVDRRTEKIYVGKWRVFDGRTGEFIGRLKLAPKGSIGWGGEIAVGPEGNLYFAGNNGLFRLDPSGKPLPFKDGQIEVPKLYRGHGNSNRGHCVAPNGDVYFVHHYHSHGNTQTTVSQVSPDGSVKRYEFIDNRYTSGSGIRVDRQGNVYVGFALKPADELYPKFYRRRLPRQVTCPEPWFYYRQMYGCIVKFRPEGGRVVADPDGDYLANNYSYYHRCRIEGAEWTHFGFSPMHQKDVESSRCNCESARFDLDEFGRLFIPDAMRAGIDVIDANANRVCRLGAYGNMDARGPNSPVSTPEIPLAWPLVVFATDHAMYVADTINRRILKARLTYAAEEEVEVQRP